MTLKKHIVIALAAIVLLTTGAVASAQTTTSGTGSTTTTGTSGSVTTPGTPNTGAGGDAAANWAILAVTGVVVIAGVAYLLRKPRSQADLR